MYDLSFNRTSFQQQLKLIAVLWLMVQTELLQSYILSTTTETYLASLS